MAMTKAEIKATYPLPVYNYKVNIGGATVAFSEVSGLDISWGVIIHSESKTTEPGAGPNWMVMPSIQDAVDITLKKGYVKGKNIPVFYDWINGIELNQVEKKDFTVQLCDETGNAVVTWMVHNAFPIRLAAPSFNANNNEIAIECMELKAGWVTMEEN